MRESGTRVFSPAGMTASLTPALALAYLHELSVDIRAAVVLDPAGTTLCGDATLAVRASSLLVTTSSSLVADGSLLVARVDDGGAIAVLAGPHALLPLLEHDLAITARNLSTTPDSPS